MLEKKIYNGRWCELLQSREPDFFKLLCMFLFDVYTFHVHQLGMFIIITVGPFFALKQRDRR